MPLGSFSGFVETGFDAAGAPLAAGTTDLVWFTNGVERARIKWDGSGAGWPAVLGGAIPVSVTTYGGICDCITVSDGAITSGLTALTSASGFFKSTDVGKTVIVAGAGTAGDDLRTTITAFVSTAAVTVNDAAGGTVSSAVVSWGTDNKTAIDAALAVLTPVATGGRQVGGDVLMFGQTLPDPTGVFGSYLTSGGHVWPNLVELRGHGAQATNIIHTGNNACFTQAGSPLVNYGRTGFSRLSLWGNNGSSARGVEVKGKQWGPYFEQAMIGNYANGVGLLLNNAAAGDFVEGVTLNALTLRSNLVGIEVRRTSGNQSFAYQRWNDFNIHVPANGVGILIGDGVNSSATCQIYSSFINGNIWLEGNNAVAVRVGAFGLVDNNTTWIVRGEIISGTGTKSFDGVSTGTFYPRGIHDFAVSLAGTQPTVAVGASFTYRPPTRLDETLAAQKILQEAFPRNTAQGTTAPTAGTEFATLIKFRRGDLVTGIKVGVTVNSIGCTLAKVAIWDSAGNILTSSADNSANFNAGTVSRVQPTALSTPYTIPADGSYYVGFLFVTAVPTLIRGANLAGISALAGDGDVLPFMQSAGGKTDVGTTSVNSSGTCWWVATY